MAATTEERSIDTKAASAVMAMAGRAVRACDVCGRDRARWYCAADEAYLCGRCDNSIHCVNALASRHERVRLGPNGAPCKGGNRSPANTSSKSFPGLGVRKTKGGKHHTHPKIRMVKDEELAQSFFSNPDDTLVPGYPETVPEDQGTRLGLPAYVPDLQGTVDEHGIDCTKSDGFLSSEVPQELDALERVDEDMGNGSDDSDEYLDFTDIVTEADFLDDNGDEGSVFNQEDVKSEYSLDNVKRESFGQFQADISEGFEASNVKVEKDVPLFQDCCDEGQKKFLSLKLNYEDVLSAWSGRGPLWTEDCDPQTVPIFSNMDVALNLDLESYHREQVGEVPVLGTGDEAIEVGGGREARVMRYREKRRTRLFSKQIRYEVRKLNAERRPRMKGRFVKRLPP